MEEPTGAPLEGGLQAFLALKTPKFRPFGWRNASETAKERVETLPIFGQGHGQRFS
jgi:hypothetical protein